jgi:hypothetical protein
MHALVAAVLPRMAGLVHDRGRIAALHLYGGMPCLGGRPVISQGSNGSEQRRFGLKSEGEFNR